MCLGTALAAVGPASEFDTIAAINAAGDKIFDGFGAIVLIFSALGLISVTALNMYGGSLTLISAIDSFKKVRPTLGVRIVTIAFTAALSLIGALAASADFLGNFENFLLLVLYLFIPWTAVNLVDYFIVRRGHYAIAEIFNPHGMYGRWGWRGIVSYLVGFARDGPVLQHRQVHRVRRRRARAAPTSRCSSACRWPASSTTCSASRSTWQPRPGSPQAEAGRPGGGRAAAAIEALGS